LVFEAVPLRTTGWRDFLRDALQSRPRKDLAVLVLHQQGTQHHSKVAGGGESEAHESLVEQGAVGQEFYLIVAGQASVKRNNRRTATIGPGEYFGELALLDRQPRSATVTAETEMELLILGQRQFNAILESVPSLSRRLLATMATRLRESDAKAFQ
jgi:CRP/FNR family cyclic AMP-dependent transcriptional regulator